MAKHEFGIFETGFTDSWDILGNSDSVIVAANGDRCPQGPTRFKQYFCRLKACGDHSPFLIEKYMGLTILHSRVTTGYAF